MKTKRDVLNRNFLDSVSLILSKRQKNKRKTLTTTNCVCLGSLLIRQQLYACVYQCMFFLLYSSFYTLNIYTAIKIRNRRTDNSQALQLCKKNNMYLHTGRLNNDRF